MHLQTQRIHTYTHTSSKIISKKHAVQSFVERKSFHNKLAQIGICFLFKTKGEFSFD